MINQIFYFATVLKSNGQNIIECPNCKGKFVRFSGDSNSVKLTCTICFWEEYYIRIKKNGEGLI